MTVPRYRQSQAKGDYIAGAITDPSSKWWKNHTNNTSLAEGERTRYKEKNPAPKPKTLKHDVITPVSKSGTMYPYGPGASAGSDKSRKARVKHGK